MGEKFMNGCEVCAGLVHLNVNASIYAPLCGVNQLQYSMRQRGGGGRPLLKKWTILFTFTFYI